MSELYSVTQAPITAFVIVMEMTDNHEMLLPLMAAAFIANLCSKLICPKPLFHTMAHNFIFRPSVPRIETDQPAD